MKKLIEKIKSLNWKKIGDVASTVLLVLLFIAPIGILAYIILWFVMR